MTMNQENRPDNQVGAGPDDYSASGEEFVFADDKKPVNRNFIVLLLIAAVGAGLIYVMYVRGRNQGSLVDAETQAANEKAKVFLESGADDLKELDKTLVEIDKQVNLFTNSNGSGQVKTEDLKVNPFSFEDKKPAAVAAKSLPIIQKGPDPGDIVRTALSKARVQTILYSPPRSTCVINKQMCSTGDRVTIDSVTFVVKTIAADHVVLSHPVADFTLTAGRSGL